MEKPVFTVSELNNYIKALLEGVPELLELCVRGELSNYKIYPSGHHYFTLKDNDSSLKCVMFRSSASKLRFRPENGMDVSAFGSISVYPRDGVYQLYCTGIMPEGTGDLLVAFEQLKAKLAAEGLFDRSYKKPLPLFPERIAVVTSSAGAAVHDIIRILRRRWPLAKVLLLPVRVQGSEAPAELSGAIRYANEFSVADLIITGRGGGSIEDLWAFNDERVARAIFASEIPVISAVGHEPDVTISDYVADARASTPSNAAEIAVPDRTEISQLLSNLEIRGNQALTKQLSALRERLDGLGKKRVLTDPEVYFNNRRIELDYQRNRLASSGEQFVSRKRKSHIALASSLDAMSPLRVLSRGYAVVTDTQGTTVRRVSQLHIGEKVSVRFNDGAASCTVENTELHDKGN